MRFQYHSVMADLTIATMKLLRKVHDAAFDFCERRAVYHIDAMRQLNDTLR